MHIINNIWLLGGIQTQYISFNCHNVYPYIYIYDSKDPSKFFLHVVRFPIET